MDLKNREIFLGDQKFIVNDTIFEKVELLLTEKHLPQKANDLHPRLLFPKFFGFPNTINLLMKIEPRTLITKFVENFPKTIKVTLIPFFSIFVYVIKFLLTLLSNLLVPLIASLLAIGVAIALFAFAFGLLSEKIYNQVQVLLNPKDGLWIYSERGFDPQKVEKVNEYTMALVERFSPLLKPILISLFDFCV